MVAVKMCAIVLNSLGPISGLLRRISMLIRFKSLGILQRNQFAHLKQVRHYSNLLSLFEVLHTSCDIQSYNISKARSIQYESSQSVAQLLDS